MNSLASKLPQLDGGIFLSDGGIETTLIFQEGLDLPHFAAFHLLKDYNGREALKRYFQRHAQIAIDQQSGFILESPTWRANADWGDKLGYGEEELAEANRRAIELLQEVRDAMQTAALPMLISACIGPRGDGYDPDRVMTAEAAEIYHRAQIQSVQDVGVDLVTAITMTNTPEAIGIVRAAQSEEIPCVISFTVETDGRLPAGQTLQEAIEQVESATGNGPVYYMINGTHVEHFQESLQDAPWARRVRGIRSNAPISSYAQLRQRFPWINVLGGCCRTDYLHDQKIASASKL